MVNNISTSKYFFVCQLSLSENTLAHVGRVFYVKAESLIVLDYLVWLDR